MTTHRSDHILVTGGCGFVGANLVPLLEASGYRVRVLDNLSKGDRGFLAGTKAEIQVGDIRDRGAVGHALADVGAVIHLAAFGSVVESVADPEENFDVNVRGTFVMLDECRKHHVGRFVFASTGGALIGNAEPPVDERSLPRPISPYGSSKLCGEAYCSSFAAAYGMQITALRFANVVGPWSWHKKGAVTAFVKAIMADQPILIFGDGSATRDFLFVDDLCVGIRAGLKSSRRGFAAYHLAAGREVSVKTLADLVRQTAGRPDYPIVFRDKRPGEVERNFATYDRARADLGFKPQYSLEQALDLSWRWMQGQTLPSSPD
ncbi:MAG: NAD-dependent epimerase/dehydratase family protein [Thiohalocapsa sp.]